MQGKKQNYKDILHNAKIYFLSLRWVHSNLLHYLLLIFVLVAVYYPVTRGYYLMEDDYWSYLERRVPIINNQAFKSQAVYAARPLGALINYTSLILVRGIKDLNYVRSLSVVLICLCSCLLFNGMKKLGIGFMLRFSVSVVIFIATSFQSNVLKIFEINAIFSALLAIISSLLSLKFINSVLLGRKYLTLAVTIFLQMVILVTYTNGITFYWFLLFVYISRSPLDIFKNRFGRIIVAVTTPLFSMVVFTLLYKIFLLQDASQNLVANLSLISDKMRWFFTHAIPVGIDFLGLITVHRYRTIWSFRLDNISHYLIVFFSLIGIISFFTDDRKIIFKLENLKFVVAKIFSLLAVIFLSISPLFFSRDVSTCYRRFQSMQAIFIYMTICGVFFVILYKHGKHLRAAFVAIFLCIICAGSINAHHTIKYKVNLLSEELRFLRKTFEDNYTSTIQLIHVIQPSKVSQLHDFAGFMTSNIAWVPGIAAAVIQDLPGQRYGDVGSDWNLGESTNKVTASPLKDLTEKQVVIDSAITIIVDMGQIENLLDSQLTLYDHNIFFGMRPSYNTGFSDSISKDFLFFCGEGFGISSGEYDGFPVSNAYDNDFVQTRWASKQVGADIYRQAFVGYDFGDGNYKKIHTVVIRQASTLGSVIVQGSNHSSDWVDVGVIELVKDSNIRAYRIVNQSEYSRWRLLADDKLPYPAAWAIYEVRFLD